MTSQESRIMTPSEAHDSAYGRPPEHDIMVAEIYEYLLLHGSPINPVFKPDYGKDTQGYDNVSIECENMYVGGRTFFADLAVTSWSDHKGERSTRSTRYFHHLVLEIKPKIYSAGAVLRQIKAQKVHIDNWQEERKADTYGAYSGESWASVLPVFKHDDPLVGLFSRMSKPGQEYLLWTGDKLTRHIKRTSLRVAA